jgi:TRAP-type C4-dicarboxylate transport system substrate-binding protein
LLAGVFSLGGILPVAAAIRIRMGTVAPKGSPWHEILMEVRQSWQRISNGEIDLHIYPGGVLGDDPDMVRKVRTGSIQSVAVSQIGLSSIDNGVACLHIPMMYSSYEELDYVRERIAPKLENRLEAQGFVVLNWGDGGWVRFFTKQKARLPDDVRKIKLFTSAGDPESEKLWKEFGFQVVPLSLTDLVTSLQTGMIDAFDVPPLFAMLDGSFKLAPNMIDLKFAPLIGGTVINKRTWEQIPAKYRPDMLRTAREAGEKLRGKIRQLDQESIEQMKQRGLTVIELTPQERAQWQKEAESVYPKLRGRYCPADLSDEVTRLRDEFRSQHPSQ